MKRIFDLYEHGSSHRQIAKLLNDEGLKTIRGNAWGEMAVRTILKNEKYKGDAELQKTYTVDLLTHKRVKNNATEVPRYYVSNHHKPIVSAEQFDRVQKIAAMKDLTGGKQPSYPFGYTDLQCPLCGSPLVPINTRGFGNKQMAYGCFMEGGCGEFAMRKFCLSQAVLKGYNEIDMDELKGLGKENAEAKRFLRFKKDHPMMDEVEFYWLDVLVEDIEFIRMPTIRVKGKDRNVWVAEITWRCGLKSDIPIDFKRCENDPFAVAELHRQHLEEGELMLDKRMEAEHYES